jgi:hypothetical protein
MDTPDIVEWEALCAFSEWLNDLYADMRARLRNSHETDAWWLDE